MSVESVELLTKIMNSHLCNRCGSCVGLSDGKIIFTDREGDYRPAIIGKLTENELQRITNACAGKSFDFKKYNKLFYPNSQQFHPYTGSLLSVHIAYSKDEIIRRAGASGGIISAVLIYLLESGKIDGAVVTGMSKDTPWLTQPFIATTREEILSAAQSKYIITSVNEILPEIEAFKGNLAYVGLPSQVQSIRKLQAVNDPAVENIKYIFGPFYGNTLHFSSIKSFLKSYGIREYKNISKLYFRHGEWPGNMRIEMNDGKIVELPKFHANYLIPFHIMFNSLLCTDLSNEFTDLSGGDAWSPVYEERGKGFSILIARTPAAQSIIESMKKDNLLELIPISVDEAITMHSHGYDLKKRGTFIRFRFRKLLGFKNPDFGYELKGFPLSRYFMEFAIDALFLLLSTAPARWIIEKVPPKQVGKIFESSRKIWKKATFKIKRENLN